MNKYAFITLKRWLEQVIMLPFIWTGKIIAIFKPLKEEYDFFMFFPIYGIGGAEKINGDVVSILSDKKLIIFFTRKSKDDKLLHLFNKPNTTLKDISRWTDNKFIYWANLVYRGICAHYINSQKKKPVIFNGQCNFAYKLFPHLHQGLLKVELIHNSNLQFAKVVFPYIPFIDTRIMITGSIVDKYKEYYRSLGIHQQYEKRIMQIDNSVYVPDEYTTRPTHEKLRVYYIGRGGYQKNLELLFEIVRQSLSENLPLEFHFAGTFEDEIPSDIKPRVIWHGMISEQEKIYELHKQMDILLMTSRFEGFPMAIMEAMSCGVAIISTAVDGIPGHIKNGENGFLIQRQNDAQIVNDGLSYLKTFINDRSLLQKISLHNYAYAKAHFSKDVFAKAYRKVFRLV